MNYETRSQGGFMIVFLSGEVDLHYSPGARQQILKSLKEGHSVLVDLSRVTYIDSSGVASLVEGYQLARDKQLEFGLVGVSDAAMRVLSLARLDKVFPIFRSVDERIASGH
jgi:anti-sigma B factor antagonist